MGSPHVGAQNSVVNCCSRRSSPVTLTEVTDPAIRRDVLRAFPREVPGGVPFFTRLGLVTKADPEQFAAVADRVAVFRID